MFRMRPVLATAALALAAVACTKEEARAPQGYRRLLLRAAADAQALPGEIERARFDVVDQPEEWEVIATSSRARAPIAGREALQLAAGDGDPALVASCVRAFDASQCNRVVLEIGFRGKGRLRVDFLRGGRLLGRHNQDLASNAHQLQRLAVEVPRQVRAAGAFDQLVLSVPGGERLLHLVSIALLEVAVERLLPAPEEGAELFWIHSEGRRGVGLSTRRPVEADLLVGEGDRLHLGFGVTPDIQPPGMSCEIVLRLLEGELEVQTETIPVPSLRAEAAWQRAEFSLAEHAGKQLRARFELHGDQEHAAAVILSEVALHSPTDARPSLLLVTTDTHRGDHIGSASGAVPVRTPELDALAVRGTLFERCFTTTNSTNPSHAALMTGEHPRDVRVLNNRQLLLDPAITLAERFSDAGYRTWAAVSVDHLVDGHSGLGQGFERMSGPGEGGARDGGDSVDVALGWLAEETARPVFLWLHVFDAHEPYEVESELLADYPTGPEHDDYGFPPPRMKDPEDELSGEIASALAVRQVENTRQQRALYKAEVNYLDRELGRLLDHELFRAGWVAVVGDHGESLGQHGIYFNHAGLYPDSLHVPLILSGPGVPANARSNSLVSQNDLGRTLLDLAGLGGAEFSGESLLEQEGGGQPHFAMHANARSASITSGGYHLVLQLRDESYGVLPHAVELFHLDEDPGCDRDVLREQLERGKALRAELLHWLAGARTLGWAASAHVDSQFARQLANLGYTDDGEVASEFWVEDDCEWCGLFE